MAQKREKDERVELKVGAETPLSGCCKSVPTSTPNTSTSSAFNIGRSDGRSEKEDRKRVGVGVEPPKKRDVNRCSGCRKRVGLTGFRCRCGDLFCALHRYSDRHPCPFDYKSPARAAISRDNPLVRAPKLQKL